MDGRQVHVQYAEPASPRAKAQQPSLPEVVTASACKVPGLVVIEDFLTEEEEQEICRSSAHPLTCATAAAAGGCALTARRGCGWGRHLDGAEWRTSLSRRVQHYGRVFDYARRAVDFDQPCRPFPAAVRAIADRALAQGLLPEPADQCTVNEYLPGQARAPRAPRHRATTHPRRRGTGDGRAGVGGGGGGSRRDTQLRVGRAGVQRFRAGRLRDWGAAGWTLA